MLKTDVADEFTDLAAIGKLLMRLHDLHDNKTIRAAAQQIVETLINRHREPVQDPDHYQAWLNACENEKFEDWLCRVQSYQGSKILSSPIFRTIFDTLHDLRLNHRFGDLLHEINEALSRINKSVVLEINADHGMVLAHRT